MKLDPTANLHSKLLAYDILFTQLTPACVCERFTVHLSLVYRVWMKRLQCCRCEQFEQPELSELSSGSVAGIVGVALLLELKQTIN